MTSLAPDVQTRLRAAFDARLGAAAPRRDPIHETLIIDYLMN